MGLEFLSQRDVIGTYFLRLQQSVGAGWINPISNYFTSDQAMERYAWLGQSPQMREWVGGRNAKGMSETSFAITNKHYEATIDILKRNLMRDKTGQAMIRIQELADRSNSHWASLLSTLIANGASSVCYDGQYFFDTDHPEGNSGTQSNSISVDISGLPASNHGSTTAPSVEELQLSIMQAVQTLAGFKDDQGEPMNESARSFLVMVPATMWLTALNAVATPLQVGASQTALQGARQQGFSIRVEPDIRSTWTANFALFRTDGALKPFIRQEEQAVQLAMKWLDSEYCFDNDAVQVGIDSWRNVGYGYWQQACLVTMT